MESPHAFDTPSNVSPLLKIKRALRLRTRAIQLRFALRDRWLTLKNLGWQETARLNAIERDARTLPDGTHFTVTNRFTQHPLACRAGSTDLIVYRQIFALREYSCLDDVREAQLIIDCGANAGYSAAYFLTRYPSAHLIAVEPDTGNFDMLRRNTAPYAPRVSLVHAAVWSHASQLVLLPGPDGSEWARQVRDCAPDENADVAAIDIGTLWRESGFDRISILKMDIEGAEAVVFSSNYAEWLDRVDHLVIELHSDGLFKDPAGTFFRAIADRGFRISTCQELTVCKRSGLQGSAA